MLDEFRDLALLSQIHSNPFARANEKKVRSKTEQLETCSIKNITILRPGLQSERWVLRLLEAAEQWPKQNVGLQISTMVRNVCCKCAGNWKQRKQQLPIKVVFWWSLMVSLALSLCTPWIRVSLSWYFMSLATPCPYTKSVRNISLQGRACPGWCPGSLSLVD